MTTIEKNKVIGKFVGVVPTGTWYNGNDLYKAGLPFSCGAMGNGTEQLKFHESWDWLMVAVEKIERGLGYAVKICQSDCSINDPQIYEFGETKIEATYNAVLEFIEWYNEINEE